MYFGSFKHPPVQYQKVPKYNMFSVVGRFQRSALALVTTSGNDGQVQSHDDNLKKRSVQAKTAQWLGLRLAKMTTLALFAPVRRPK
jgi:hypothetical protein